MSKTKPYPIVIDQGATWRMHFVYYIDDVPVDLTGCNARMAVRGSYRDANPLLSLDSQELGGITLGGTEGSFEIVASDAQTSAMPAGIGVYDIELITSGGEVRRLFGGKVEITPEVTR